MAQGRTPTPFDQPPRRALAALTPDTLAVWHLRYCPQEGLEMRAQLTLEATGWLMRETGAEVTTHALWVDPVGWARRDDGRSRARVLLSDACRSICSLAL